MSCLALQRNISNCLVLIPHRQLGNYLLTTGESYGQTAQHIHKILYRSMFDTYQHIDNSLGPRIASCSMHVVVIYFEKQCLTGVENLAQSPAGRTDMRETPATKAVDAADAGECPETCVLGLLKLSLPKKKSSEHQLACIAYCYPRSERSHEIHPMSS